ncbi:MAG: hypothetical protein Q8Q41_01270 [bacterium]|nr:hypothetical protein [bacterium]
MRKSIFIIAFLLILSFATSASGDERVLSFTVETPRSFGYVIGDEIVHEARIAVKAPLLLVPDTIPQRDKINDWLTVTKVEVRERNENGGRAYTLRITYQIFHEPDQIEWLTIPERKLGFAGSGDALEAVIPAWSFTVMPFVPEGADEFAKDRPAQFVPIAWPLARFAMFTAVFLGLALALFYRKWGRTLFGYRGPFASAEKDLRRQFRKGADDAADARAALKRLHRAFDETAGKVFFAYMFPELLVAHPWLEKERNAILKFFEESGRTFFGTSGDRVPASREYIQKIARALKRAERRRGR